ncbi:MAG: hypothetical protein NZM03_07060 [Limisphaera sp.]|nr:hypothetical protein [Limisphaera sp.]
MSKWLVHGRKRIGPATAVCVTAMFATQLCADWVGVPRKAERLAAEFASIGAIQVDPAVAISGAADLLGVFRSTENGVGIFIVDLKDKSERVLAQALDSEYYRKARAARIWGWSTDDSLFAYTWGDEQENYTLVICNRTGEQQLGRVPLPDGLRAMKWLGPDACAYIDWATNLVHLKRSGTDWERAAVWRLQPVPGRPALEALDADTVAIGWIGGTELWQVELASGKTAKLYTAAPGNSIDAVRYEPARRAFLVSESARRATRSSLVRVSRTGADWVRHELGQWPTIRAVEWLRNGAGYALHIRQGENNYLLIKPGPFESESIHFKGGGVVGVVPASAAGAVYAIASVSNEPPAIWACDGETKTRVYSLEGGAGKTLKYQPVLVGWAPFDGHNARFELVPPADFSRSKKYPLVIGLASYTWSPVPHAVCAQTLARAGAYVALSGFTFRDDLRRVSLEHVNNINAIYNIMVANPNVDADRVFLFAFSGSTTAVCELLKQYPGRFKGVILLHPAELPEPKPGMCERVLLTAGVDEDWTKERIAEYQEALCKVGIPLDVYLHEAGGHIARAQRTMRERAVLMAKAVFD